MSVILNNVAFNVSASPAIQREMHCKQVTHIEVLDVNNGALEAQLSFDNGETFKEVILTPVNSADVALLELIENNCFTTDADTAIMDMEASNLKEDEIVIESVGFQYN